MPEPEQVIPFDELPEKFAEKIDDPPDEPVRARPAATVVLIRPGGQGLEVLLLRRNRKTGFVPGAYVFPGGRVDSADGADRVVERVDGLGPAEAARRLGLNEGAEPPAIAYFLAAVREAFEETGVLVGSGEDGGPPPPAEDDEVRRLRDEVMEDRVGFGAALEQLGCRVDGHDLAYIAHWITPVAEPRRYDTRFFAAAVPEGTEAEADPREMLEAVWLRPEVALSRHRRGELPMIFPTIKTLESLTGFGSPREAVDAFASRRIPTILPRLVRTDTGVGMLAEEVD